MVRNLEVVVLYEGFSLELYACAIGGSLGSGAEGFGAIEMRFDGVARVVLEL